MKSRLERNGGGSWARLPWSEEADSGTLVSRGALACLGVWGSGFRGSTAHQPGLLLWDPQPGAGRKRGGGPAPLQPRALWPPLDPFKTA